MSLLALPAELRLRIYDHLPELQVDRTENVTATSKLTPSICRVNRLIRRETLCVFANNSNFTFFMDDGAPFWPKRVACWMETLGPELLPRIRSLQLSRHWAIPLPFRYQGQIGFYVKFNGQRTQQSSDVHDCLTCWADQNDVLIQQESRGITVGTYPMAKDSRKARLGSAQLLANMIRDRLVLSRSSDSEGEDAGLASRDVDFMVRAMNIAAVHPILTWHGDRYDQISKTWSAMVIEINALSNV